MRRERARLGIFRTKLYFFSFLIYLTFNGFGTRLSLDKRARFVDDVYFYFFLPACGFEGLVLKREGGKGGGDCTFDLAVRREGLVLGLALHEWVLVQERGGWMADGWIGLALTGLLGFLYVCRN